MIGAVLEERQNWKDHKACLSAKGLPSLPACSMWTHTDRVDLHAVPHELGGRRRDDVVDPLVVLRMPCTDWRVMADLHKGTQLFSLQTTARR